MDHFSPPPSLILALVFETQFWQCHLIHQGGNTKTAGQFLMTLLQVIDKLVLFEVPIYNLVN